MELFSRIWGIIFVVVLVGCDYQESRQVPKATFPSVPFPNNLSQLKGVSDPTAPNKILGKWHLYYPGGAGGGAKKEFNRKRDFELPDGVFDADGFIWSDSLQSAIMESQDIKWLRIGQHVDNFNLEQIVRLKSLRGLSLQGSKLRTANLEDLKKLQSLQWLDLSHASTGEQKLPQLPELEVLIMYRAYKGAWAVPSPGQFPKLRSLTFTASNISDLDVKRLVQSCPNLVYLNLGLSKNITVVLIDDLSKLKELRYLQLCDTSLATSQIASGEWAILELRRRLPNCYIDTSN